MISKKKKIFILVGMIALLVVTGVLNIYLNANAQTTNKGGNLDSIFDTHRADRIATRQDTLMVLDAIIASEFSTEQMIVDALEQKNALTKAMDTELTLERVIKTLGYSDVIVTASTEFVNVIIRTDELDDVEVAQITHLVVSETQKTPSSVRIMEVQ